MFCKNWRILEVHYPSVSDYLVKPCKSVNLEQSGQMNFSTNLGSFPENSFNTKVVDNGATKLL